MKKDRKIIPLAISSIKLGWLRFLKDRNIMQNLSQKQLSKLLEWPLVAWPFFPGARKTIPSACSGTFSKPPTSHRQKKPSGSMESFCGLILWYEYLIHDFFHSWPILIKYTSQQHRSFSKCISTLLRSPKCRGKGRGHTCCKLGSTNQRKWRMNNHQQHQAVVHSKKDFKKDKESGRLSGSNQPKCQIHKKIHVERWCSESRF